MGFFFSVETVSSGNEIGEPCAHGWRDAIIALNGRWSVAVHHSVRPSIAFRRPIEAADSYWPFFFATDFDSLTYGIDPQTVGSEPVEWIPLERREREREREAGHPSHPLSGSFHSQSSRSEPLLVE